MVPNPILSSSDRSNSASLTQPTHEKASAKTDSEYPNTTHQSVFGPSLTTSQPNNVPSVTHPGHPSSDPVFIRAGGNSTRTFSVPFSTLTSKSLYFHALFSGRWIPRPLADGSHLLAEIDEECLGFLVMYMQCGMFPRENKPHGGEEDDEFYEWLMDGAAYLRIDELYEWLRDGRYRRP